MYYNSNMIIISDPSVSCWLQKIIFSLLSFWWLCLSSAKPFPNWQILSIDYLSQINVNRLVDPLFSTKSWRKYSLYWILFLLELICFVLVARELQPPRVFCRKVRAFSTPMGEATRVRPSSKRDSSWPTKVVIGTGKLDIYFTKTIGKPDKIVWKALWKYCISIKI